MTEKERLIDVIRGLVEAIEWGNEVGCIDHLDCADDSKERFYEPLERGKAVIRRYLAKRPEKAVSSHPARVSEKDA